MRFDVQPVCVNYFHPRNRTRRSIKLQKGERKTNKRQKDQEKRRAKFILLDFSPCSPYCEGETTPNETRR